MGSSLKQSYPKSCKRKDIGQVLSCSRWNGRSNVDKITVPAGRQGAKIYPWCHCLAHMLNPLKMFIFHVFGKVLEVISYQHLVIKVYGNAFMSLSFLWMALCSSIYF